MEEIIRMQILAYLLAYFTTLTNFKNLKIVSWVFIPPKLNIYTINLQEIFPCPLPFKD